MDYHHSSLLLLSDDRTKLDKAIQQAIIGLAIEMKKNLVISGGIDSGKIIFLNARLQQIPTDTRIVKIPHGCRLHSIYYQIP